MGGGRGERHGEFIQGDGMYGDLRSSSVDLPSRGYLSYTQMAHDFFIASPNYKE